MGWSYQRDLKLWEADDYKQDPPLRLDNIHQKLIGQDKEAMDECFSGTLEPLMTGEFFARAEKEEAPDGIIWKHDLEDAPSGERLSIECALGERADVPVALEVAVMRDGETIYLMRYEWAYWNHYASKSALDYGRRSYPEVPETRWDRLWSVHLTFGIGSDRGMEEDLDPITWGEVGKANAEEIARALYEDTLRDLLGRGKEITNGTVTVRLDEYNMKKMLAKAEAIKAEFGADKVITWVNPNDPTHKEHASYTGDRYCERVKKMVDVAHRIMEGDLVPDLLDALPLKKAGTFKKDQTIVIFDGKISDVATYDDYYAAGEKMCLGITTGDDYWSENKGSVDVGDNTARLAIITLKTTRKLYPLLSEDLEVQDIKTKTTYLKQDDVKAGSVYAEKSGTKYLYVGRFNRSYQYWDAENGDYLYLRYTKKLANAVKDCGTLSEMQNTLDKMEARWSCRENPRNFVSFVEEIVPPVGSKSDKSAEKPSVADENENIDNPETGDGVASTRGN